MTSRSHRLPLSTGEGLSLEIMVVSAPETLSASGIAPARMERLWSLAVATSGNRWQMPDPENPRQQAKTVATGCDQLPLNLDGKEVVDGSSPVRGL